MRKSQIQKMTCYGVDNKGFLETSMSFYSNMLYNLGVLAARLQVIYYYFFKNVIIGLIL